MSSTSITQPNRAVPINHMDVSIPYDKPKIPFYYFPIAFVSTLVALGVFLFFWQVIQASGFSLSGIEHGPAWAHAVIAKPALTNPNIPVDGAPGSMTGSEAPVSNINPAVTATPSVTPTLALPPLQSSPTSYPSATVEVITPTAEMAMEASPTPLPTDTDVPLEKPNLPVSIAGKGRWIDVDLSKQMVYAYEGDTLVNSFLVSTGVAQTPTVTGQYRIYVKYHHKDMSGLGYYLPDVPFIMYFFEGYGFHGTYWHNNFGTPMSRGCVNLSIPDAEWLYNFASVGTLANIHY